MDILDRKIRYVQIAFNYDIPLVRRVLPTIPYNPRIWIEAGTPYIKREGMRGVQMIRSLWRGVVVADMKTVDGAIGEVEMAKRAGADAITVLGNAPRETLNLFISHCAQLSVYSMIDMLGVADPLEQMRQLKIPPNVVVLHRGRDEEGTRGSVIKYRHINRVRSKYDVSISAAGGVDLKEARSAIFNGSNVVVFNIVRPDHSWQGISTQTAIGQEAVILLKNLE
jgi:bifunctional enzyme Fae/Hps